MEKAKHSSWDATDTAAGAVPALSRDSRAKNCQFCSASAAPAGVSRARAPARGILGRCHGLPDPKNGAALAWGQGGASPAQQPLEVPKFLDLKGEDALSSMAVRRLRRVSKGSAACTDQDRSHNPTTTFPTTPLFPDAPGFVPNSPPAASLWPRVTGRCHPSLTQPCLSHSPVPRAAAPSCSGNRPGFPRLQGTRGVGVMGEAVASSPTAQGRQGGSRLSIEPVLLEK